MSPCIVLVVEDEPLIAHGDRPIVFKMQAAKALIARTLKDAMRDIATPRLTAAVIDHALQ